MSIDKSKQKRLQENLSSIRKIAGWTADDLGGLLGVTKQNISNIENLNTNLSKAQYIAIRHLIDYRAKQKNNYILIRIVRLLIDESDFEDRDYNAIKDAAKNIGIAAVTMKGNALEIFADTLLSACYTRTSDFTEIEGKLKRAIKSKRTYDWTADLYSDDKEK